MKKVRLTVRFVMEVPNKLTENDIRIKAGSVIGHEVSARYSIFKSYEMLEIEKID